MADLRCTMGRVIFTALIAIFGASAWAAQPDVQLTTTNGNFMSLIAGFTARMQCSLYNCGGNKRPATVAWFKDDVMLFNGTEFIATSGFEPSRIVLQKTSPFSSDNCVTEDFTLLLKNLTLQDAGEFRCQLLNFPQQLDFHLDVLDSGLKAGFHQNFTYDYAECCLERGISPLCRSMCKPRDMDLEFFDPTSCKTDDYKNFLQCATNNGRRDYVPCCRQRFVPSFCYDFCSNKFEMLKRSHRLCLYYLPEIFSCFTKQHEMYPPSTPTNLRVSSEKLEKLCWRSATAPINPTAGTAMAGDEEAVSYWIHIKAVPDMMLKGSASIISGHGRASLKKNEIGGADGAVVRRGRREAVVLVAQESSVDRNTQFTKLDPAIIERSADQQEICVSWGDWLKKDGSRYVAYVQASNDYGTSEPSQPLFITTLNSTRDTFQLQNHISNNRIQRG